MADLETTPNGERHSARHDTPPTDAVGRRGAPPQYDTEKEGYAGISSGALDHIDDVRAARDFAEMIVDTVREGLLVLDLDLRVKAANESFYRHFGVDPEDTVGRFVYDLGNGQWDIPELRELLEGILPHEKVFNDYEVEHDFEGIGRRVMLLNARRLDDHQLVLLAIEDVTERWAGERELRLLNETLEARVEERTRQVRELSRALTLAEQAERRRLAHLLHDDLQQVLHGAQIQAEVGNAERVAALLDDAVGMARSLSHELSPPLLSGERLVDLLDWVAQRKRSLYGLDVEVEVAGECLMPEEDLRVLIYQLVRELLYNVAKHAGTDRARVTAERAGHRVRVVVEDEGVGFDPATLEEVAGVGLGLPSVRDRLEIVGGRLDVESTPGEGTRVALEVPLRSE
jgi:PAS domain S-box-containing protein